MRSYLLFVVLCVLLAPVMIPGQEAPSNAAAMNRSQMTQWVFAGKVKTLEGAPISRAKVRVEPLNVSAEFRYFRTDSQGRFYTEYYLASDYTMVLKELNVRLTVTKKGFHTATRSVYFSTRNRPKLIPITLLSVKEDPALLSRADLISDLAPRLRKLGAADGLSAAEGKDYARGVEEFLDRKQPEKAVQFFNRVIRGAPSCLQCHTMLGLAQLGAGDWDGAYSSFADAVHSILKEGAEGHSEPMIAAGVLKSWQHDPKSAAGFFVEAIKFAPHDPLALQELGRSQLLLENWSVAREYLLKAIAAGAGPDARLMCAAALLGAGDPEAADKQMADYLDGGRVKAQPPRVRELWAKIQARKKMIAGYEKKRSPADKSIDYLHGSQTELSGLEPAANQKPLDSILSAVGKRVAAYFKNFQNTSSLEEIHQEVLRGKKKRKAKNIQDQRFRYLCFTPAEASGPGFREFRTDLNGTESYPRGAKEGFMLTLGFASAPIVFLPAYQSQATFRYLGRQKVDGREEEVIAFAQQPAKVRIYATFQMGQTRVPTLYQGLAWIDSKSHQIVRIRTDLLRPLPDIDLHRETTDIKFGEVHFKGGAKEFWLPQRVVVDVDWNGKHLRTEHRYSEFKLFSVESKEKIQTPKQQDTTAGQSTAPQKFD